MDAINIMDTTKFFYILNYADIDYQLESIVDGFYQDGRQSNFTISDLNFEEK